MNGCQRPAHHTEVKGGPYDRVHRASCTCGWSGPARTGYDRNAAAFDDATEHHLTLTSDAPAAGR
jgi:hypothetical protein